MVSEPIPPFPAPVSSLPASAESLMLQHEVEQLLYQEARILDDWNLDAWLTLYTPDARYIVPTTDLPDGNPETDLVFIDDDYSRMAGPHNPSEKSPCSPGIPLVPHPPLHRQRDGHRRGRRRSFRHGIGGSLAISRRGVGALRGPV